MWYFYDCRLIKGDSLLLYLVETIPKLKTRGSGGAGAQASGGNQSSGKKSKQK